MGNGNTRYNTAVCETAALLTPHGEREQLRILCAREVQKSS